MTTYTIEKGVPVPVKSPAQVYPFGLMEVGDSFGYPAEQTVRVSNAASQYGKATSKKFITRKVEGGHRCWRVS